MHPLSMTPSCDARLAQQPQQALERRSVKRSYAVQAVRSRAHLLPPAQPAPPNVPSSTDSLTLDGAIRLLHAVAEQGTLTPKLDLKGSAETWRNLKRDVVAFCGGGFAATQLLRHDRPYIIAQCAERMPQLELEARATPWAQTPQTVSHMQALKNFIERRVPLRRGRPEADSTRRYLLPIYAAAACAGYEGLRNSISISLLLYREDFVQAPQFVPLNPSTPPKPSLPLTRTSAPPLRPAEQIWAQQNAAPKLTLRAPPPQRRKPPTRLFIAEPALPPSAPSGTLAMEAFMADAYFEDVPTYLLAPAAPGEQAKAIATLYGLPIRCDEAVMRKLLKLAALPGQQTPSGKVYVKINKYEMHDTIAGISEWLAWVGRNRAPDPEPSRAQAEITGHAYLSSPYGDDFAPQGL